MTSTSSATDDGLSGLHELVTPDVSLADQFIDVGPLFGRGRRGNSHERDGWQLLSDAVFDDDRLQPAARRLANIWLAVLGDIAVSDQFISIWSRQVTGRRLPVGRTGEECPSIGMIPAQPELRPAEELRRIARTALLADIGYCSESCATDRLLAEDALDAQLDGECLAAFCLGVAMSASAEALTTIVEDVYCAIRSIWTVADDLLAEHG